MSGRLSLALKMVSKISLSLRVALSVNSPVSMAAIIVPYMLILAAPEDEFKSPALKAKYKAIASPEAVNGFTKYHNNQLFLN
ncbi:MAG: hypothetical protein JWR09_1818 [Mucilaginibacter sp.]|nr:hypothetical protein [Mucilaginibacter sp.]